MKARIQVRDVMTRMPHGVTVDQTLSEALEQMRELGVHHLPVTHEGKLVGLLGERDLELVAGLDVAPERTPVAAAMGERPYVVAPDEPLAQVIHVMVEKRLTCTMVVDAGAIVGIVTTSDALRLLEHALDKEGLVEASELYPSEVRARLSQEHGVLRRMSLRVKGEAEEALASDSLEGGALKQNASEFYAALLRHLDLEDEILTPALREIPVSGPIRAGMLLDKHAEQRRALKCAQARLDKIDSQHLSLSLLRLSEALERELAEEERWVLNPLVLHDDLVSEAASDG